MIRKSEDRKPAATEVEFRADAEEGSSVVGREVG
jgi:hypothetical protein